MVRRSVLIMIVSILAGAGGTLLWLVGSPPSVADATGDAIFVHAGGQGERIQTALDLFESGAAPLLVVSDPEPGSVPAGLCASSDDVLCVVPVPPDTSGEAQALAAVVDERSLDSVIVVTSDYHLRRAAMLDRSCTAADVVPAAATSSRGRRPVSDIEVQEAIALVFSWLFQRC